MPPIFGESRIFLLFDGKSLQVYNNDRIVSKFSAVAGRPFYQNPKSQFLKNKGPLPEGQYILHLDHTVYFKQPGIISKIKWLIKYISWGNLAIPLEPKNSTDLKGRHSFMIHGGGWVVGSKGCVVVYAKDKALYQLLKSKNIRSVDLVVNYSFAEAHRQ
jgi:hypothetical protein